MQKLHRPDYWRRVRRNYLHPLDHGFGRCYEISLAIECELSEKKKRHRFSAKRHRNMGLLGCGLNWHAWLVKKTERGPFVVDLTAGQLFTALLQEDPLKYDAVSEKYSQGYVGFAHEAPFPLSRVYLGGDDKEITPFLISLLVRGEDLGSLAIASYEEKIETFQGLYQDYDGKRVRGLEDIEYLTPRAKERIIQKKRLLRSGK